MAQRKHNEEKIVKYDGNASRTVKPRYSLIPKIALDSLTARYELGQIKHKDTAWNGLSPNYNTALTDDWVVAALEHVIHHAYIALEKLKGVGKHEIDDDAGAIMFGGSVLACYNFKNRKQK